MSAVERFSPGEILYEKVPEGKSFMKDVLGKVITLPPTSDLCNEIADTGKEMAQYGEEPMQGRAKPVLRIASHMFHKRTGELLEQAPLKERELFDFTRVVSLQEEAGDTKGAQITAKKALTTIVTNENRPDFVADEFYSPVMDVEKKLLLDHLDAGDPDSPNHPLYIEVVNSLSTEKARKDAEEDTHTKRAIALIDKEKVDEGFAVAHAEDVGIRFILEFTHLLDKYITAGDVDKAKALFETFIEHDFNRLERNQDLLLTSPMFHVLIGVDRSDVLARMIKGTVRENEDGTRDTNNADYFAMKGGAEIARQGGTAIDAFQELLPEYLHASVQEGFTIVRKDMNK